MGQIVVNVGSFDLTSHNGNTAYSTTKYFDIPANAGITGCVATFAQHVNTGSFQGKSFSLNGAQAHPNTPWPTSGISLNPALLATGQNTFRAAVKSQAGLSARWSIGDIYLTITYNDIGGGDPPPPPNIGTITLNKSSMLAGETVNVSLSPCDNGIYRSIRVKWQGTLITSLIVGGDVPAGGDYSYTFPLADCTRMPNDTSGPLTFEMETSVDIMVSRTMIILVPDSVVPTIGTFTATRDANGVDAAITKYVQNYSKVNLAMGSVAGALGSGIQSHEITGAGFNAATASAVFGPFSQTGDITFTAKVTDTRGRTATRAVTINVLSYGPPAFSNPEAWRSSDAGVKNQKGTYARLKSGVVYSSLDGQNSVTLKGMVHIKGGTVPAYTSMTPDTPWITGGGTLLVTKTYIAQMEVADLIGSRVIEFTIPTKKTGISIMAGMQGIAFGKSAEIPGVAEFGWPIYNCPYEIGDILQTLNTASPEDRWPGTEWEAISGRVLVGLDSAQAEFDTIGETGGEKTHTLIADEMPEHVHEFDLFAAGGPTNPTYATGVANGYYIGSQNTKSSGGGEAHNNLQPYKVVYMWLRTA